MDSQAPLGFNLHLPPRGSKRTRSQLEEHTYDYNRSATPSASFPPPYPDGRSRPSPQRLHSRRCPFSLESHSIFTSTSRPSEYSMAPPQTRTRPQLSEVRDHEVIDLTSDDYGPALPTNAPLGNASRGPRFGHNIIDITEESSPEVQFLSSRRLPVPQHQTSQTLTPRSPTQIEMDVEMELEITGSAPVPQTNNSINNSGPMSADYRSRFDNFALRVLSRAAGAGNARLVAAAAAMDFIAPILDFQTVGFEMGMHREETASPVSIYQAPPAPPEGFTRSAEEGDVLVCPNCGDELCSGETESKKQVWIVKGCGHVYCGECTKGRFVSKAKKAKSPAKTKTFSSCVVDGCTIKTSGKTAMIQLFL